MIILGGLNPSESCSHAGKTPDFEKSTFSALGAFFIDFGPFLTPGREMVPEDKKNDVLGSFFAPGHEMSPGDKKIMLELPQLPIWLSMVPQRRASRFDGALQNVDDSCVQLHRPSTL